MVPECNADCHHNSFKTNKSGVHSGSDTTNLGCETPTSMVESRKEEEQKHSIWVQCGDCKQWRLIEASAGTNLEVPPLQLPFSPSLGCGRSPPGIHCFCPRVSDSRFLATPCLLTRAGAVPGTPWPSLTLFAFPKHFFRNQ